MVLDFSGFLSESAVDFLVFHFENVLGTLTVLEATSFSYNDTFVDFERQFSAHQRGAMFVYFSGALSPSI